MKRVLILSQPLHNNYGGLLQAFALQKVIRDLGYDAVTNADRLVRGITIKRVLVRTIKNAVKWVLGYNVITEGKKSVISTNTQRFVKKHIQTESIKVLNDEVADRYDIFVVGSDQVLRKRYSDVVSYFLYALRQREDKRRVFYAASFGTDDLSEWGEKEKETCRSLAPKFDAVSVREDSGIDIFKNEFGVDAELVLDPTLLLEKEEYLKTIEQEDLDERDHVLMCYVLDKTPEKLEIIDWIKHRKGLELLEVMAEEKFNKHTKNISRCVYPSVSKWIAGFRDAEFVVTDSFHGTVFSIIFNKPFVCIANKARGLSRFTSLLKIFGLEDRLIFSPEDFSDNLFENIDYDKVNAIKQEWREKSVDFLKENLG